MSEYSTSLNVLLKGLCHFFVRTRGGDDNREYQRGAEYKGEIQVCRPESRELER